MRKRIFLMIMAVFFAVPMVSATAKYADFAGSWYKASPAALKADLKKYLNNARVGSIDGDIIGLVAPHAGYEASGSVAAYAFKALEQKDPDKVIVVGFTHRLTIPGRIAAFTDDAFVTPLGRASIDMDITRRLIGYSDRIRNIPQAFMHENSVELEIPFIQMTAEGAELVLISICDQSKENCAVLADALYDVLRDENNFVIIASTDLSHDLRYEAASKMDMETAALVEGFDPDGFYRECAKDEGRMCGPGAVYATMLACKKLGADEVRILKYGNSGDVFGKRSRIVGYLSAAFIRTERIKADRGTGG
jgi:AmmeMemoRadiSam system protein B